MYLNNDQASFLNHGCNGELFVRCIDEVARNIQAPWMLVAATALSAISTSLQGVVDVEWPDGRVSPTSLYILIRGKSGERKSTVFNRVFYSIISFQKKELNSYKIEFEEYERRKSLWDKKRDGVLKKISRLTTKAEDTSELEKTYLKIEMEKPLPPRKMSILYDDATPEALIHGMSEDCKYASLVSSEGGNILRSGAFRDYAKPNELWSGGTVKTDRKSVVSSLIENGRLSICIMVQPEIHDIYLHKEEDQFRGSGLWARFLVSEPDSTIGSRQVNAGKVSWEHSDKFAERLTIFLDEMKQVVSNGKSRQVVKLTRGASEMFLEKANQIEFQCRQGHCFSGFEDHASKLPENILRIAALLQTFEHGIGSSISVEVMNYSINIAIFLSDQFRKVFYVPTKEEIEDRVMKQWMHEKVSCGYRFLRKNYIQKNGPSRLRSKECLNLCMERLEQSGSIKNFILENIQCVDLLPHLYFDPYQAIAAIRANRRAY